MSKLLEYILDVRYCSDGHSLTIDLPPQHSTFDVAVVSTYDLHDLWRRATEKESTSTGLRSTNTTSPLQTRSGLVQNTSFQQVTSKCQLTDIVGINAANAVVGE